MPDNFIKKFIRKPVSTTPKTDKEDEIKIEKMEKTTRPKDFKKGVSTMADDVADLITDHTRGGKKADDGSTDMQRKLTAVYTDSDGHVPDLTKLEKGGRSLWRTVTYSLIGMFLVLLIAGVAGFIIFTNMTNADKFTNEDIIVNIETPITLSSGEEMEYTINIKNEEEVSLYNAQLQMTYPENFEFISSEPIALGANNDIWDFRVLKVGEKQQIKIKGRLVAAINSTQTFKGVLTFKPANLNAEFKQESIKDVIVMSSLIDLTVEGPKRKLANQDVEYLIKYENTSEEDIEDLQLVANYPEGFVLDSATPEPESDNNKVWEIKTLKAGASEEIKIKGNYSAIGQGGNSEFIVRIQLKLEGDYYPQSEDSVITNIIKDQLSLQVIVNGSAEDQPINFDDLLVFSIHYKNSGQEDLEDVEIKAVMDSQILDWDKLQDDNNGKITQNTIVWTGKEVPQLLKLSADEEGEVSWTIRVKDAGIIDDGNVNNFSVETHAEATLTQGEGGDESTVNSKTITNSINSDLTINAQARYYNEDNMPLGAGPIEPTVDTTSNYNIVIDLSNNLHDVENLSISATLPDNISWINKENHSTGDVIYNKSANKVTWTISRLSKSAHDTNFNFNVGVKPEINDLGRVLILVSSFTLTGKDSDTGADIHKSLKAVTTAFDDPILGRVSGIVE